MTQAIENRVTAAQKLYAEGQSDAAAQALNEVLAESPAHPRALYNMGILLTARGLGAEAENYFRRAIAAKPDYKEAHYNLGVVLQRARRWDDARAQFLAAISLDPGFFEALMAMGGVLRELGDYQQSIDYFRRALAVRTNEQVYNHIATSYKYMGKGEESAEYYQRALLYNPGFVPALNELGATYMRHFRFEEAQNYLDCAQRLGGDDKYVLCNLSALAISRGRHAAAVEYCRRGLAQEPSFAPLYHNIMMAMVYAPDTAPRDLYDTARAFDEHITAPLRRPLSYRTDRNPTRRLRIGYVSGDFRQHSVSYFLEGLLKHHAKADFEIFAYTNVARPDDVTERLRGLFDHWRNIYAVADDAAADMIEADKIDILIDLSGHTDANRLAVFARKPAPVQISWLGFPATTGMAAMDYRITDALAEPPGLADEVNVEKLLRLPDIFCCYSAGRADVALAVNPPLRDNGYVTFGCFNNFAKVSDEVLRLWARILASVPESRLMLEIADLDSHHTTREVRGRIVRAGLPIDRVILVPRRAENQFVLYNRIDIALDPFPCNGGTTSMDCLWMGVPFITLAGDHFLSRMGVTILTNAGLPELIAADADDYVAKAAALAGDTARITDLRHGLRHKLMSSPVMDQGRFARAMEDAYRRVWRDYCAGSDTE